MPDMQIPKKLLPIVQRPKRFTVLIGGRGSGKSMTVGDVLLMRAQTEGIKVGCFREFQNSIDDSVLSLLSSEIERLELADFEIQNTQVLNKNGSEFKFKGLARNPESVKSMHGFDVFWVEEGQTISFKSLKALTPTLRKEGSQIFITANPGSRADPFSQRFIVPYEKELLRDGYYEDDMHLIIVVNYFDNKLFPEVLEQERAHDEETLSRALYEHIWLGKFYDEVEGCIIPVKWFDACIDAHKKLGFKGEGALIAAYDPSDEGEDAKGYCLRHGSVVLDVQEKELGDVAQGTDWALDLAVKARADWFGWDCDGLGISLKQQVDKSLLGKKIDYYMFRGSETPDDPDLDYVDVTTLESSKRKTNRETFKNKRAQYYWALRDRVYATYRAVNNGEYINPDDMISFSSEIVDIYQLRSEVCRIPIKHNNNGKIQIMSKIEMSKKPYQLPSPNMADALMMCMYKPAAKVAAKKINFAGWGG